MILNRVYAPSPQTALRDAWGLFLGEESQVVLHFLEPAVDCVQDQADETQCHPTKEQAS